MSKDYKREDFSVKKLDKKNILNSKLVRSNIETEFTIQGLLDEEARLNKISAEVNSQVSVSKTMCANIVKNNKTIEKMSPEFLHAVWMYKQNLDLRDDAAVKAKEIASQLREYGLIFSYIKDLTGFNRNEKGNKETHKGE